MQQAKNAKDVGCTMTTQKMDYAQDAKKYQKNKKSPNRDAHFWGETRVNKSDV